MPLSTNRNLAENDTEVSIIRQILLSRASFLTFTQLLLFFVAPSSKSSPFLKAAQEAGSSEGSQNVNTGKEVSFTTQGSTWLPLNTTE